MEYKEALIALMKAVLYSDTEGVLKVGVHGDTAIADVNPELEAVLVQILTNENISI
jgi:hypothetical protein